MHSVIMTSGRSHSGGNGGTARMAAEGPAEEGHATVSNVPALKATDLAGLERCPNESPRDRPLEPRDSL